MTKEQLEKERRRQRAYWEKRDAQLWAAQDMQALDVAARLVEEYAAALRDAQSQIAAFYQQYGRDNVVEYRSLMAALSPGERRAAFRDFDAFLKENPQLSHLGEIRNRIYKLNRLEALEFKLTLRQFELGALEQRELSAYFEKAYRNGYENVYAGLPNTWGMHAVPEGAMKKTLNAKWTGGGNYSERIWQNRTALAEAVNKELREGLLRGDSYQKTAELIAKRFSTSAYNAQRLVFTESAYVMNQANRQAFMDAGVEEYQFTAVLDRRTSALCRRLDGQVFRFEEAAVGVNYPPMHPWCRSTVVPYNYGGKAGLQRPAKPHSDIELENLPVTQDSLKRVQGHPSGILTNQAQEKLADAHRQLLEAVRDLPMGTEAAFYYDMDMELLKKVVGDPGTGKVKSLSFGVPFISIHNHPSGQTFTEGDLLQMLEDPAMMVMNAVGNQGRVYALERDPEFNVSGLYHAIEDIKALYPDRERSAGEYLAFMYEILRRAQEYGFRYYG